ncbi:MAG TPA: glycoside hydrolase family 66 protein, partial [Chloroflexia bacterium]|nr:glycoside hydrolase family 66 protein [Chloroflexia bacterium]
MLTIDDIIPDKATYRPGETARISVTVSNGGHMAVEARLTLALTHVITTVEQLTETVRFEPNARTVVQFDFTPPPVPLRGYGLDATLHDEAGQVLAQGSGALDVLERWSQAPRYGFLSDFAPGQTGLEERCDSLLRYHLNVVQFYDWMWRHYKLLPPSEEFTDGMGRRLSLNAVRAAIEGVQARGGAAMAYGAVYGAEPEFADEHPELVLYDEAGERVSLAGLFYIMNIAPDSPWVPLIVGEFAEAVRVMGFD